MICKKCNKNLSEEEFPKEKGCLRHMCKICTALYKASYYNMKNRIKHPELQRNGSYEKVFICEEWCDKSNFDRWCDAQREYFVRMKEDGLKPCLDKDVLSRYYKLDKQYSPITCCFLPEEINRALKSSGFNREGMEQGVSYHKIMKKYQVSIQSVHIGTFDTKEEANECSINIKKNNLIKLANKYKKYISETVYKAIISYY